MKLQAQSLRFSYRGGREILAGLTLSAESPGVFTILGVNGAGKSTLLKCLARQLRPDSGTVLLDGRPAGDFSSAGFAKKIAYIPQTHEQTFPFPVIEVVMMGRAAHLPRFATPGARDREIALEKLDFLGIGHLARAACTEISGGERQLVMLAAALAQEPEMLLLDEPTAHLDFGNQHRFLMVLERLVKGGMGVVMTSHFPDQALFLGGEVGVMAGGSFVFTGPAREAITTERLTALYGLPVSVVELASGRRICVPGLG